MIELCPNDACTGCMACKQKCVHGAIVETEINGFKYPKINAEQCVSCGLCARVCPVLNKSNRAGNRHKTEISAIAAYSKDSKTRNDSSSGGMFSVIAEYVLAAGGIVYGASWDKNMTLFHEGITSIEDLDKLRRSKYVQSDILNTYNEVLAQLATGRQVLFCGTPCQVAGLHSFLLGKYYENLLTVDVLCQGVPSAWSLRKYFDEIEKELGIIIFDCNFRFKRHGWYCGLSLLIKGQKKDGSVVTRELFNESNSYYRAFYREYFLRPSCYSCQFKNDKQGYYSDLTIADFWRIGNSVPLSEDGYEKGFSAILINSEKGGEFLKKVETKYCHIERSWKEFATNSGLRSCKRSKDNDSAFDYLRTHSWRETQQKFFPVSYKERVKVFAVCLLGQRNIRAIMKTLKIIK